MDISSHHRYSINRLFVFYIFIRLVRNVSRTKWNVEYFQGLQVNTMGKALNLSALIIGRLAFTAWGYSIIFSIPYINEVAGSN